jgi:hypothetical protein
MERCFGQIPRWQALLVLGRVAISQHMAKRSPLDDSRISAHAWARYKRLMKGMAVLTTTVVALTLGAFYWQNGVVSVHFFIATALGIGFMMMLTAALMGLVFLSSGTGHDESVSGLTDQEGGGRKR